MKSPCLIALAIIFGLPGCSRDTGPEQVTASEVSASTRPSPGSESPAEVIALALSLDAQGEKEEGAAVRQRYENIWARADVSLESSVL